MVSAVVAAGALTTLPGGTAHAVAPGMTSAQSAHSVRQAAVTHRASIKCTSPKGAKANYSWGDGSMTVTVYFNNHCRHRVPAKVHIKNSVGGSYTECLVTNGGTKGRKKFHIGLAGTLTEITKGC
ncbi:hypothetical protein [Nonomuraea turcica]|uniref:hypothetical protein n=1 Tax=Nonomuraea sp. G32 TaxID=3067274 RepID=UPI00273A87EE|nr:hypothetical protein [Nonomuraea sp. G32]MDP4511545.1 hypothetical protein [Nonomuraea sp. G32]